MFGRAGSNVGATGSGTIGSRSYSFFNARIIHCDLRWCHSVNFPLVVKIAILEVYFVVFSISALHHTVVVNSGNMLRAASQTFGWENFLLGTNYVNSFFGLIDFVLKQLEETAAC